ncbi:serine hydrolase [Bifidobacterium biavatii]|nr:serine hydrolase [Bifidobacterium biavatii]
MSFTLRDAEGNVLRSYHGDRRYYAASTMKLVVGLAVLRLVDAGAIRLDDVRPATHVYESAVGGTFGFDPDDVDPGFPAEGEPITVRDLFEIMIDRSCNEATNMLIAMTGYDALAATCALCRLRDMHVDRMIGDVAAAKATGIRNEVTTDDLSSLMLQIVRGDHLSRESTLLFRGALSRQQYAVIGPILPAGTPWGSKSGWVDGINHDVAFVGAPDSASLRILSVCTGGYGESQAHEAIRAVTSAVL